MQHEIESAYVRIVGGAAIVVGSVLLGINTVEAFVEMPEQEFPELVADDPEGFARPVMHALGVGFKFLLASAGVLVGQSMVNGGEATLRRNGA